VPAAADDGGQQDDAETMYQRAEQRAEQQAEQQPEQQGDPWEN
jgi:hypothetical protein